MVESEAPETTFYAKSGLEFRGVSSAQMRKAREDLFNSYGLNSLQICEAASYSLAMVVRFALGLSASGGKVYTLVNDSLAGQVGLACARHLLNAGGQIVAIPLSTVSQASDEFRLQLKVLEKMGAEISPVDSLETVKEFLKNSHNFIFALYGAAVTSTFSMDELIETLNDSRTPIHCIEAPYGINVDTGETEDEPLFASSTLSLGAPYRGLFRAREFVGRHYICDISLTKSLYLSMGDDLSSLFSDQPVVQIFPMKPEKE